MDYKVCEACNKKLALIGQDLLFSKKYGFKRKFNYEDFNRYYQYKQILLSSCEVNCRILEKIKIK